MVAIFSKLTLLLLPSVIGRKIKVLKVLMVAIFSKLTLLLLPSVIGRKIKVLKVLMVAIFSKLTLLLLPSVIGRKIKVLKVLMVAIFSKFITVITLCHKENCWINCLNQINLASLWGFNTILFSADLFFP